MSVPPAFSPVPLDFAGVMLMEVDLLHRAGRGRWLRSAAGFTDDLSQAGIFFGTLARVGHAYGVDARGVIAAYEAAARSALRKVQDAEVRIASAVPVLESGTAPLSPAPSGTAALCSDCQSEHCRRFGPTWCL
mgnify:CR=1 FL=1